MQAHKVNRFYWSLTKQSAVHMAIDQWLPRLTNNVILHEKKNSFREPLCNCSQLGIPWGIKQKIYGKKTNRWIYMKLKKNSFKCGNCQCCAVGKTAWSEKWMCDEWWAVWTNNEYCCVIQILIVWRLRGNIIRTAPCWVVWHNVHSQQHTRVSSSYMSSRLGLSHCDPYAMHRDGCLELYYCNMVEWSWWDSRLIWKTNWLPSVLSHCWFAHMTCKNRPRYDL